MNPLAGIAGIAGSFLADNMRKRKRPVSGDEGPRVGIKYIKTDGDSLNLTIPESSKAACTECGEHVLFTEIDRHPCKEYSSSGAASLQGKKIDITDPEKKYRAHQLTALAWILRPHSHKWEKLAEAFDLLENDRKNIEAKYNDNELRMLAVLNAVSEQFQKYRVGQMNKGQLIRALQNINVDDSTLEKINNAKLEEQFHPGMLVTMQTDCPDEQKIQIHNPCKLIQQSQLPRVARFLGTCNSDWKKLAMVFYYSLSDIEDLAKQSRSIYGLLYRVSVLSPDRLNKRMVMTALQLIGMQSSDLDEINSRL